MAKHQRFVGDVPDWFAPTAALLALYLGGPVLLLGWDEWEKEGKALAELVRWNELGED